MSILEAINNIEEAVINPTINKKGHMIQLSYREFETVYRGLKLNRSMVYIDKENEVNFVVKLNRVVDIKEILYYKKIINVKMDLNGPIIELIVDGLDNFEFCFDINVKMDLLSLKNLKINKSVNVHFVTESNGRIYKFYTAQLQLDDKVIERIEYALKCLDEVGYPRIDEDILGKDSIVLEVEAGFEILDGLIKIVESLQKWGSKDCFSVTVDFKEKIYLCFVGELNNKNYIINELQKKYKIIETDDVSRGKKFLKFDRGMIYFYN